VKNLLLENFPWKNKHFLISYREKLALLFPTLLITKLETDSKNKFFRNFISVGWLQNSWQTKQICVLPSKMKYKQLKHHLSLYISVLTLCLLL
jgi:hypothetical protein